MKLNLLKLQQESGFYGHCFTCGALIGPERLKRGADTCSQEHQTEKRKAQRRFSKLLNRERLVASPSTLKRLLEAGRSAPEVSESVNATV